MHVLLLAPHPYYQDRGSPIAVNRVASEFSRLGAKVDLVTYHEGTDVSFEGVTLHRIPNLRFVKGVRPGFSWKKLVCDVFLILVALRLLRRTRYDLVHAVEEAVFVGLLFKILFGIPYVYDMDSSLAEQMIEKFPIIRPLLPLFRFAEKLAVKNATATLAVCEALADTANGYDPTKTLVLWDVSLLERQEQISRENLRETLKINGLIAMYVGNLEEYQGIDLLLKAFALVAKTNSELQLVIIGGTAADIAKYETLSRQLMIDSDVHFVGPRPVDDLALYLAQADILLSPRIKGNNTPMKVFSYLDSGKPVIATNLLTHTQVLSDEVAVIVEPSPPQLAAGMLHLIRDEQLRLELGIAGKELIKKKYSEDAYRRDFAEFYHWVKGQLGRHPRAQRPEAL